jgi:hypothetical protein
MNVRKGAPRENIVARLSEGERGRYVGGRQRGRG